jgi:Putative porin
MNMFTAKFMRATMASMALALAPIVACLAADERQSLEELRNTVINLLQALVDQGVITREKAEQMVKSAQEKAAANAAAAAKADEGAVRVPYVPQIVKDEIAKQVAEQVKPEVVAGVVNEAKTEKWGVPGALADWLTRTRISGSVTLREEDITFAKNNDAIAYPNYFAINTAGSIAKAAPNQFENTTDDRARFRGRARLEVDSDISNSITAGIRVATGNTSDLVSETQTLDGTAPYQFGVDELFIRLDERNAQKFPWLTVVGGRFLNPYGTPTDLIFHKDLTFEGVAATGRLGFGDGSADQSHVFFTLGAHPLQEVALSAQDKWLTGAQLGTNLRWGDGQHLRVSGAFYDYFNVTGRLNPADQPGLYNYTAPTFERQGNTYFDICNCGGTSNLFALASKFRLGNVNVSYELPVGAYTLGLTADAVKNFGFNAADVSSRAGYSVAARTKGYQAEVSFGYPTVLTAGAWRAVLGYRYLQSDAVIDAYTDSDFHFGGTNALGYYFVGDYGVANRVWIRVRYLSSNAIDLPPLVSGPGFELGIDTLQVDLNTRF